MDYNTIKGGSRNTPSRFILQKLEISASTYKPSWLAQFRLGQTLPTLIHSDEGLKPQTSVFESFTVTNLTY